MQKLFSELIAMPVIDEYSSHPIALVRDIIIDPETGIVIAFEVGKNRIITPMDIARIGSALFIRDAEHIVDVDEVLRVKTVKDKGIFILGSRVVAEKTHEYMGKAVDFSIDTKSMSLAQIFAAKTFFFFRFNERIFARRDIVRIKKGEIIMKNKREAPAPEKEKAVAPETAFAS